MNEQKKRTAPKFNSAKSSKAGDALAAQITGTVAKARPQSIAEGLTIIVLAVGRAIQVLGMLMGVNPKIICKDFCNGLTKYFELGGDGRIDDIMASLKQKGN